MQGTPAPQLDKKGTNALYVRLKEPRTIKHNPYVTYDVLRVEFARLNGLKVTERAFTLEALARGMRSGGKRGEDFDWPGADHLTYLKRRGWPAAVITEPYNEWEVEGLHAYAADSGLAISTPPNPWASFWYPGYTYMAVLTRPDFGQVRWLKDQLDFTEQPAWTRPRPRLTITPKCPPL